MSNSNNILNTLSDLLIRAKAKGADACDVIHIDSTSIAVAQRLGKPEKLERSESVDIGLRVVLGKSQAIVSSSDISPEALEELSGRAVAMARSVPKDPYCGLADPEQLVTKILDLESCDPQNPLLKPWSAGLTGRKMLPERLKASLTRRELRLIGGRLPFQSQHQMAFPDPTLGHTIPLARQL